MIDKRHIYLTGFMGSGKSTVGALLAHKLGLPFLDTDAIIANETKMSVSALFSQKGESAFRKHERATLRRCSTAERSVISTGGGSVLSEKNRGLFKKGMWFHLHVPFALLKKRLNGCQTRPLAQDPEALSRLWVARLPLYRLATHIVSCGDDSPEAVCQKILRIIRTCR